MSASMLAIDAVGTAGGLTRDAVLSGAAGGLYLVDKTGKAYTDIASHGFIVVGLQHTYSTAYTLFEDGTLASAYIDPTARLFGDVRLIRLCCCAACWRRRPGCRRTSCGSRSARP